MPRNSKQEQTNENTIHSTKKWFIGTQSGEKIVQMDPYKFLCVSESRRDAYELSAHWAFDLSDLKDRRGMDFAFISKDRDSKLHLAVWAHQSALSVAGRLETMFRIPKAVDRSKGSIGRHKPFYHEALYNSLVTHCILLRYLYTGELTNQVDLRNFHITYAGLVGQEHLREPTKAYLAKLLLEPIRTVRWDDIWPLAARYEMHDLVEKCVTMKPIPSAIWKRKTGGGAIPIMKVRYLESEPYDGSICEGLRLDSGTNGMIRTGPPESSTRSTGTSAPSVYTLADMKNGKTVDMAIVCRDMDVNIHAAVWVHQDKLASIHQFAVMHSVPKDHDLSEAPGGSRYKTAYFQRQQGSFLAHYALFRYIYTGKLTNEIDLHEFYITAAGPLGAGGPIGQSLHREETKLYLRKLLKSPVMIVEWSIIHFLAQYYAMNNLANKCQVRM